MSRPNLLNETINVLYCHGYDELDVLWVGSKDGEFAISWQDLRG